MHVNLWAQLSEMPLEFQNHMLDNNLSGIQLSCISTKDLEVVLDDPVERQYAMLALQCLKHG
ncbi:hypothetical protein HK102_006612, partial [Quaeritorhiza haematococci]